MYRFFQTVGQVLLVLFFDYRFYGIRKVPKSGPVIIASNHQSFMDPVVVGVPLNRRFASMARESLFKHPVLERVLRSLGSFPLSRGNADLGAMREGLRVLKGGGLLLLFPEGTRTFDGKVGELHPGLAVLAGRSGAWVVPTAIDGAYECWPRRRLLPRPGRVRVAYGRPMKYVGHGSEGAEEFMRELRARIEKLQTGLRDGSIQRGRKDL